MSTITAILEPDPDGTLHLPLPEELRHAKVRVTATLEAASGESERPSREAALAALRQLRERGTFQEISDPVAWQRETRQDRPLPAAPDMLLDRNVLISAANGTAPALEALVVSGENAVASVTQIEVYGFTGLQPEEKAALDTLFRRLTVYPLDEPVIQKAIELRRQRRMPLADAVIAATAPVHRVALVTRNTEDFRHLPGLQLIDPLGPGPTESA